MRSLLSARRLALAALLPASCAALVAACNSPPPSVAPCESALWSEAVVTAPDPNVDPADQPRLAGQCLSRVPDVHDDGTPECVLIEGTDEDPCNCDAPGRKPVEDNHQPLVDEAKARTDPRACYCEIVALTGAEEQACQNDAGDPLTSNGEPIDGYCHVSRELAIGDPDLMDVCPQSSPSMLRFTGDVELMRGQVVFTFCATTVCDAAGDEQ